MGTTGGGQLSESIKEDRTIGQEILKKWDIRPDYYALMQLLLGYPKEGDAHPTPKPRKDGRVLRF